MVEVVLSPDDVVVQSGDDDEGLSKGGDKGSLHYHGERKSDLWIYVLIGTTVDYGASDAF